MSKTVFFLAVAGLCAGLRAGDAFQLYNIVPYAASGTEARTARDMVEYRARTGCDLALYSLTLDPEGKPAMEKVHRYLASYRALKQELDGTGVRLGVLVQAIFGHWKRVGKEMEDWTRTVNVKGEKVRYCPDDPDFAQYITDTFTLIAKERPAFVLTDDDVRAYSHDAECFCPRHIAEFNRRRGTSLTEAEVRERVRAAKQDDEDYRVFLAVQRDMMHRLVRRFRNALDSVDPAIPAGICMSGEETFLAGPLARIIAAGGQVPVMRIGNGCYRERYGTDLVPNVFRTLGYAAYYGDSGIRLLDEADTCPHNLWSKSAIGFFTHLQVAAFSGFSGAKVWYVNGHKTDGTAVSRNYTDVLAENRGVLDAIVRETAGVPAAGLAVPCFTNFPNWHLARNHSEMFTTPGTFAERVLMPFGIPFRLEKDFVRDGTYLVSTADEVARLSDADLERLFSHRVLVTADAAVALSERGRTDLIGLSAAREALACNVERDNRTGRGWGYGYADKPVRFSSLAEGAEALTTVGFRPYAGSPDFTAISPGAVRFRNRFGGTVVTTVYHGNMFAYSQFSTARKDYLLGLAGLMDASVADFTCGNEQDVLVQVRRTASDAAFVLATNLNGEPIRAIRFRVPEGMRQAAVLSAGGEWRTLAARQEGDWVVLDEPLAFTQTKVFRFTSAAETAFPVEVRVRQTPAGPQVFADGQAVRPRFYFGSPANLCNMAWTWETQFNVPFRAEEDTESGRVELPLYDGEKPIDFYDADLIDLTAGTTNFIGGRVRTDRYVCDGLRLRKGHLYRFRVKNRADHDRTYFHYRTTYIRSDGTRVELPLPYGDTLGDAVRLAADAGVNLVTFSTDNSWGCDSWWNEAGDESGFARLDALCERLIRINPKVLLIPRIIGNAPDWFLEKHPESRMKFDRDYKAAMVSVSYRPYRKAVCEMIEKLVRHLQWRFPRNFAGLHVGGQNSAEWFYFNSMSGDLSGYDVATRDAFREYLAARGEKDATEAEVPSPEERRRIRPGNRLDPVRDRRLVDFVTFRQLEVASLLRDIGEAIRRGSDGRCLSLFFYGYTWELSSNAAGTGEFGHNAMEWLQREGAHAVDGFSGPFSYNDRNLTGSASVMSAAETCQRRGFLWINEDDTRTCREEFWDNHSRLFTPHTDRWTTEQILLRDSISGLLRGTGEWWMDLFGRGWHRDPELWKIRKALNPIDDRLLKRARPYEPEIAVAADDASLILNAAGSNAFMTHLRRRNGYAACGGTYGQYFLDDLLSAPPKSVRLVYLVSCDLSGARGTRLAAFKAAHPHVRVVEATKENVGTEAVAAEARKAGVHLYTEPGRAIIEAAEGYVMVQARQDGPLAIDFGVAGEIRDALTDCSVGTGPKLTLDFRTGEVRLFRTVAAEGNGRTFPLPNHPRITSFDLMDQTDNHNELLTTREWTAQWNEQAFSVATCVLDVQDAETGSGRVFVRLAPLPHARPVKTDDFRVDSLARTVEVLSNGSPFVTRAYEGGRIGRIRALNAIQREIRPYRAGRDGRILSNNWGGGYSDARLNEDYALREIEAGAKLGVEVIELDDGWQKGRSANSLLIKDRTKDGVWNGYWAFDPNFWDADPVRFSHGLAPLVAAAKAHGMDFGLWFGPDSSNDAANWEKDADRLLAYYRDPGIRYFKIDSMKSFSPLALSRQRAMFDRMLAESSSNIVFDLDVTAEIRPGYFGLPDIGTLFVENRYAKHCSWWPHQTLRNLWSLSEVVDPVRLRMEFLDPKQHDDRYAARFPGSPLRPELWTGDAVFATVMLSSPLCWMEIQGLQPETVAEMAPLIATWKRERDRLHEGVTFPVGAKPDGFSWTGFVTSAADGKGGYVLLFRECAKESSFALDLSPYLAGGSVETLSGAGTATLDGTCLRVEIPEKLGYLWLKVK